MPLSETQKIDAYCSPFVLIPPDVAASDDSDLCTRPSSSDDDES